ncbi:type IV secretory system conjugative DNA transfer family protein [Oceanicaulis alexandrii]|uniref:type IV secretory system conjugative DNA transfer family protein n=1 Tax=Oceanicaulis alexandrii TaxID=153233 RepID=UPI003B51451E
MKLPPNNERHRYGSARFTTEDEMARAGMFRKGPDSLFVGFLDGRSLYYSGAGGLITTAAARSGKLATVLAYNSCVSGLGGAVVFLDVKGEISKLSQIQFKPSFYWNPRRLHGLPYHRINPVDYIRWDSPSLVSDVKVFCENMIPLSGSPNSSYFELRAREFLEAVVLTIVKLDGVLTLPRLYHVLMLIPAGGDAWLDFAFEMSEAGFAVTKAVEEEIAAARGQDSGGFRGTMGELFKSFAPLSDPVLMEAVSPPYDMSLADLCGSQACNLYLMPPAECLDIWGGVLKAFFVAAMIYKSRAPSAPRQTWILDEVGQLGRFPLIVKLFTYGAGIGIRPWAIFQSAEQMKVLGPNADTIISSSAGLRQYFAVRDDVSAARLSRQLGTETLEYDDRPQQAAARLAREEALHHLIGGGDPMAAALALSHHGEMETHRSQQQRWLRTMDEVIGTPNDRQFIFADGLSHPIYAERAPYWEQRAMAGRFLPNPFHPPHDRVRIKTMFGHDWRRVITERVPSRYAHLPQYADGYWSYVEGFRP